MRRLGLLTVAIVAISAAPAHALLVYDSGASNPSVWAANDDGSGARRLASGSYPKLSPDGKLVAYMVTAKTGSFRPDLMVVPSDGSEPPRLLAAGWRDPSTFSWSPDSRTIVTVTAPELGRKRLTLIDVSDADETTIASGAFAGVSFAPDGGEIVYGRSRTDHYPYRSDVYSVPSAGGRSFPITHDRRSEYPLWGPNGRIVFVKLVDAKRRRYGPKNELYLMALDGSGVQRLTYTKVDPLLTGLVPTAWSADGTRLLAEFEGQDTSYAVKVDPRSGAQQPVVEPLSAAPIGAALSRDGTTILGATGGFDPSLPHSIVAIPYAGGTPTTLVKSGFDPDWNR
jgi:Tol biopolymer transport system component